MKNYIKEMFRLNWYDWWFKFMFVNWKLLMSFISKLWIMLIGRVKYENDRLEDKRLIFMSYRIFEK